MKDITRRIFEKENQAEVSNNIEKRSSNKSFTQLVSLTLLNNERAIRQPKELEYKSIDLKPNNYSSLTQRPFPINKQSFHSRVDVKQKTTTTSSIHYQRAYSPIQTRHNTSASVSITYIQDYKGQEVQRLVASYADPILEYFDKLDSPLEFLKTHTISTNLRAKMVDWMVEVLTSYKCKDQTFFMAVRLMDQYLYKTSKPHAPQDLHLVGVTSMFMACKFEEIYPVKLQVVHEKIAHKKLTKDDIKDKETIISQTLDFNYTGVTLQEYISLMLSILNKYSQLYTTAIYLAKMSLYEYELISQHSYKIISGACIILGSKIVEQVDNSLQSEPIIPLVLQTLNLQHDETMEVANKLLKLAKGFEKQFPNLENLKKFNKFSFQDALKSQK